MKIITAEEVARLAPYHDIVEALRRGFRDEIRTPVRHHHDLRPNPFSCSCLPGPRTTPPQDVVFKSDNAAKGLPTIQASYLLIDNATGRYGGDDGWWRDHPPPHGRSLCLAAETIWHALTRGP